MEPQTIPTNPRMNRAPRTSRYVARLLAVLALAAAAVGLLLVVSSSLNDSGTGSSQPVHHAKKAQSQPQDKYYVVQPGDTFGGIAAKEGVSVARLEKLNPNLDTQVLPERGCVNLQPEGCKVLANANGG
jgi:hypothetical protein